MAIRPNNFVFVLYYWATLLATAVFHLGGVPGPGWASSLYWTLNAPADVLRSIEVGRWLDAMFAAPVDALFALCGGRLWVVSVCLVLVTGMLTPGGVDPERERSGASGLAGLVALIFVVCTPALSQTWSGLFMARGVTEWQRPGGSAKAASVELGRGLLFAGAAEPERVVGRALRAAGVDETLETGLDAELTALQGRWRALVAARRERRAGEAPGSEAAERALVMDLVLALEWHSLLSVAVHGYGGHSQQSWREVVLPGPGGSPIAIETNIAAPLPVFQTLRPVDEVRASIVGDPAQSPEVLFFKQHIDAVIATPVTDRGSSVDSDRGSALQPADVLFQVWGQAVIAWHGERRVLELMAPDVPLAATDPDGRLAIKIANNAETYRARNHGVHAGAGLYVPEDNAIYFMIDEREFWRGRARTGLRLHIDGAERSDPSAARGLRAMPPWTGGLERIMTHELVHWSLHAQLSGDGSPGWRTLPRCLDEGLALLTEMQLAFMPLRASEVDTSRIDTADFERARATDRIDWAQRWLAIREHHPATPAQTAMQDEASFRARGGAAYPGCWAFAALFGADVLERAARERRQPGDVVQADERLRTPWSAVQEEIRGRGGADALRREVGLPHP